ncbi:WXG100 family type VII secretion target [Cryptosporangium arvum]|jgi:uncharacterized protein YukE|uniref:WXG100 family type VII secretion target n=1 Tax=Cryptosporangium arvum TaxID=80871 RepID=UPI0004B98D40|nr:hypothetical protein [Cryptosporangium arvum]
MPLEADDIFYEFEGVQLVSEAIASFCKQMDTNLAEVDAAFASMTWESPDSKALFEQCKTQWHQGADGLREVLQTQLAPKVGQAGIDMHELDKKVGARFLA